MPGAVGLGFEYWGTAPPPRLGWVVLGPGLSVSGTWGVGWSQSRVMSRGGLSKLCVCVVCPPVECSASHPAGTSLMAFLRAEDGAEPGLCAPPSCLARQPMIQSSTFSCELRPPRGGGCQATRGSCSWSRGRNLTLPPMFLCPPVIMAVAFPASGTLLAEHLLSRLPVQESHGWDAHCSY